MCRLLSKGAGIALSWQTTARWPLTSRLYGEIEADLCGLLKTIQTGRNDRDRHHAYQTSQVNTDREIPTGLCRLLSKGAGIIIMTYSTVTWEVGYRDCCWIVPPLTKGAGIIVMTDNTMMTRQIGYIGIAAKLYTFCLREQELLSWQTTRWWPDKSDI